MGKPFSLLKSAAEVAEKTVLLGFIVWRIKPQRNMLIVPRTAFGVRVVLVGRPQGFYDETIIMIMARLV